MGKRGGWGERKRRMGDKGRRRSSVGEGGREGEGGGVDEIRLQQAAKRGGESVAFPPRSPPGSFVPTPLHLKKNIRESLLLEKYNYFIRFAIPHQPKQIYMFCKLLMFVFSVLFGAFQASLCRTSKSAYPNEAGTLVFFSSKFQNRKEMPFFFLMFDFLIWHRPHSGETLFNIFQQISKCIYICA